MSHESERERKVGGLLGSIPSLPSVHTYRRDLHLLKIPLGLSFSLGSGDYDSEKTRVCKTFRLIHHYIIYCMYFYL